jgi:hypothetical protein
LTSHRRSRRALFVASAAIVAAAVAPGAAGAAVSIAVTGDDGNPVALAGTLNIRNMSPVLVINAAASDRWSVSATGPNGAVVAPAATCAVGPGSKPVDYVGNGVYTVTLTTYNASCAAPVAQTIPFTITASTAITPPAFPPQTRPARSKTTNLLRLAIDLNPGAQGTDVFVGHAVTPNLDGSLPGTPVALVPDAATRTVDVPLNMGPGTYVVAARARSNPMGNPQAFSPWAAPVTFRAFAPFDVKFAWTDRRGPSYRFHATIVEPTATGRVNIAIGRGTKGKYRSLGTAKIRKHAFSKRFRVTAVGTYRIRFRYKGNDTVLAGQEIRGFSIASIPVRGAGFRSAALRG